MNAINNYLWTINTYGSLHEGINATNMTNAWLRAHTMYDDLHPYEAMEIIKLLCADSETKRNKAFAAAKQGFEYYLIALDSWNAKIR